MIIITLKEGSEFCADTSLKDKWKGKSAPKANEMPIQLVYP